MIQIPSLRQIAERKLANAILYFVGNTNDCYKTKLVKLVYYADVIKLARSGKPLFGLEYQAWKFGPVPVDLFREFGDIQRSFFYQFFDVKEQTIADSTKKFFKIVPKRAPDLKVFSRAEKAVLDEIVEVFKEASGMDMVNSTHEWDEPWTKTWKTLGEGTVIDKLSVVNAFTGRLEQEELSELYDYYQNTLRLQSDKR